MSSKSERDRPVPSTALLPSISAAGIELAELETFIAVAQTGSFSAAAQRLYITQPAVTGRIKRLETVLNVRLLDRTTRSVQTTAQGALLLHEAIKALEGLSQLVQRFRVDAQQARQRVVVAASPTLAALRLPPFIRAYGERHPDVALQLLDLPLADVLAALDDGRADIAVAALDADDARYRFEPLWADAMVVVVPAGHPLAAARHIAVDALAGLTLSVGTAHLTLHARMAAALQAKGLVLPPPQVVSNMHTLLGMLDAGIGVSLLPRLVAVAGIAGRHAIVEVDGVDLQRRYGIVSLRRREPLGTAAASFCRFMVQQVMQDGAAA